MGHLNRGREKKLNPRENVKRKGSCTGEGFNFSHREKANFIGRGKKRKILSLEKLDIASK